MQEAPIVRNENGLSPQGPGWFILNARDCPWYQNAKFGEFGRFEGSERFQQVGVNLHILHPGQPNCYYHSESAQEDFLILSGECLLLIEGQERRLKAWDFVHCPPHCHHVFVGAGETPCLILMLGARAKDTTIRYPVEPLAQSFGAGVAEETNSPREAYAQTPDWEPCKKLPEDMARLFSGSVESP